MVLGHRLRYKPKIHLRFGISFSSNGSVPTAINTLSRKEKRDSFCILLVITFRWEQNWTLLGELKGKTHSLFQGQELWLQVPLQTTCFICLVFSHHICWMKNDSNSMQSSLDRFYGILFLLNMNLCCNYMRRKEKKKPSRAFTQHQDYLKFYHLQHLYLPRETTRQPSAMCSDSQVQGLTWADCLPDNFAWVQCFYI